MMGLSTRGSISLGWALVAGRKRVPRPAAGKTALRTFMVMLALPMIVPGDGRAWRRASIGSGVQHVWRGGAPSMMEITYGPGERLDRRGRGGLRRTRTIHCFCRMKRLDFP